MTEKIRRQCTLMSDAELVRSQTRNAAEYVTEFHEAARQEMAKRRLTIEQFRERVTIRHFGQESAPMTIDSALHQLNAATPQWDLYFFINALGEELGVERDTSWWTAHSFRDNAYSGSFTFNHLDDLRRFLDTFLRLEPPDAQTMQRFSMDEWFAIYSADSLEEVTNVAEYLQRSDIPHTVKNIDIIRTDVIFGGRSQEAALHVLVPHDMVPRAKETILQAETYIEQLYALSDQYAESGDTAKELSVLEKLAKLAPRDFVAHFNRGVLLYEAGRFEEAADAFVETTHSGKRDLIEDAEGYLYDIHEQFPENIAVLDALGAIAMQMGDADLVAENYGKLLAIKPDHPQAHAALGYMYYQTGSDVQKARHHLSRYIRLQPNCEDRQAIDGILTALAKPTD